MNSHERYQVAPRLFAFRFGMVAFFFTTSLVYAQFSRNMNGVTAQHAISVTSELVVLPVKVTDAKGNVVSGLHASDFRVFDGKRVQNLTLFEEEDTPVSVGLIVDDSTSMKGKLSNVVTAISAFARSGNPDDEMFVVHFSDRVRVEPLGGKDFTSDSEELAKAVNTVAADGRTALYDAVAAGLAHLQLGHQQRKALILISDGGDNASDYKYSQILELARRSQVAIYSLALVAKQTKDQNPKVLRLLAKDTGGAALFPDSEGSVLECSTRIARDLREQYVLGFVPEKRAGRGEFRKVQVQINSPRRGELHVRTRSGYFAGNETTTLVNPLTVVP